jgi:glycosyltransferase involved in cell wall biosynthesis
MQLQNEWLLWIFWAFCTIAFIQVIYLLFFFSRLAFINIRNRTKDPRQPLSVIVCARDEASNLVNNLPGILLQQYPGQHEVIVVNDNSVDESKYVLSEIKQEFPQMKVIELTQEAKMIPGKKFPLSIGIKSAAHDTVLLTDADCVPASEHWISAMMTPYEKPGIEIVLGYGAYHKKKGLLNKIIRWETFHTAIQYLNFALAGIPYMGVGRNLSYKKELFFRLKGFSAHNNIAGGDDDLFINMAANRKNTAVCLDKNSFTLSRPAKNFSQWIAQKKRHYSTSRRYKPLHKFLLSAYSLTHFLYYPLFISALFFQWQIALIIFTFRMLLQGIIYFRSMQRLGEKDLFPLFPFFDLGMFFYYLSFAAALFRKNRPAWK